MKKIAFVFAAIVAVSFASCGNKTEQAEAIDSDSVAVDTIGACCSLDEAPVGDYCTMDSVEHTVAAE